VRAKLKAKPQAGPTLFQTIQSFLKFVLTPYFGIFLALLLFHEKHV
jgi:hypothetical protein